MVRKGNEVGLGFFFEWPHPLKFIPPRWLMIVRVDGFLVDTLA
ncbi:MAG: hypothetical protein R8K47_05995 [Mariprofundaceae bacterium]